MLKSDPVLVSDILMHLSERMTPSGQKLLHALPSILRQSPFQTSLTVLPEAIDYFIDDKLGSE